jgi:DNA-binding transcriptional MocR family regulator
VQKTELTRKSVKASHIAASSSAAGFSITLQTRDLLTRAPVLLFGTHFLATSVATMSTAPAAPMTSNLHKGAPAPTAVINLRKGTPATSELPRNLLQKASKDLFALNDLSDTNAMQYGDDFSPFTAQLSKFLTREYGQQVLAEEVYPVSGVSHGLDILSSVLATAGDVVLCEVSCHSETINPCVLVQVHCCLVCLIIFLIVHVCFQWR